MNFTMNCVDVQYPAIISVFDSSTTIAPNPLQCQGLNIPPPPPPPQNLILNPGAQNPE